jgi:hypothetical protein
MQKYILLKQTDVIQSGDEVYNYTKNSFSTLSFVWLGSQVRDWIVRRKCDNPKPGDYLLLNTGDTIQENDQFYDTHNFYWLKTEYPGALVSKNLTYRRLVTQQVNQSEYVYLKNGDIIQPGDEYRDSYNNWNPCYFTIDTKASVITEHDLRRVTNPKYDYFTDTQPLVNDEYFDGVNKIWIKCDNIFAQKQKLVRRIKSTDTKKNQNVYISLIKGTTTPTDEVYDQFAMKWLKCGNVTAINPFLCYRRQVPCSNNYRYLEEGEKVLATDERWGDIDRCWYVNEIDSYLPVLINEKEKFRRAVSSNNSAKHTTTKPTVAENLTGNKTVRLYYFLEPNDIIQKDDEYLNFEGLWIKTTVQGLLAKSNATYRRYYTTTSIKND